MRVVQKWRTTLGLCADVALEFRPTETAARLFTKDKYLEQMFGDAFQARTNAAMLLLPIDTTSSRTCTKPIVACSCCLCPHFYVVPIICSIVSPF